MSVGKLFKVLARDAGERLGVVPAAAAIPPEPLKLRRGGFVRIDPLPYRMLQGHANFELGEPAQPIATRGLVDLKGSWLHRYYLDDDETWLQVKTDGGTGDANISECILWQYWDTKTPTSHAELREIAGPTSPVGLPTFEVGAFLYQRVWGVARGQTELVPFLEQVFDHSDSIASFSCQHYAMLYRRLIEGSRRQEYVLISVEECPDSVQMVTSLGVDLNPADLTVT
ncbi:MAG TPA: DUF2491 family protein [Steroidobacteraceae bacterium]|nr:DUF2491 family protein [Steroidobacteraceae bacterium]